MKNKILGFSFLIITISALQLDCKQNRIDQNIKDSDSVKSDSHDQKPIKNELHTTDIQILQIDSICSSIDERLNTFSREIYGDIGLYSDLDSTRYSFEGDKLYNLAIMTAEKFIKGDSLLKLKLDFNADGYNLISEYYVKNNDLILVKKYHELYDQQYIEEEDKYINSITDSTTDKYYFAKSVLIKFISKNKANFHISGEEEILHDFNLYLTINKNDVGTLYEKIKENILNGI